VLFLLPKLGQLFCLRTRLGFGVTATGHFHLRNKTEDTYVGVDQSNPVGVELTQDRQTDKLTDKLTEKLTDRQKDRQTTDGRTDGQMDRRTDGRTDGRREGSMDGWIDR